MVYALTLIILHNPATGSVCPRLDLMEPMRSGSVRPEHIMVSMASNSSGSPTGVPIEIIIY